MTKRWILPILLLAAIGLAYLLLPAKRTVRVLLSCDISAPAAYRGLSDTLFWQQVMGAEMAAQGYRYRPLPDGLVGHVPVEIRLGKHEFQSELSISNLKEDSVLLIWQVTYQGGYNLVRRMRHLSSANLLEEQLGKTLLPLRNALEDTKKLYGTTISRGTMTDSVLLTYSFTTPQPPSTANIYQTVDRLLAYARSQGADTVNAPMMLSRLAGDGSYTNQVALPLTHGIREQGSFRVKYMVLGNNLHTTIVGPESRVQLAFPQLYRYVDDYNMGMPAIPYASLITDRRIEPDSSKWVTRVVFPVM